MCGIAGYFGRRTIAPAQLEQTLRHMRQRGPDHAAWRHFTLDNGRQLYLLHSRLSIIDLDPRSNQPLHRGSRWITYNGELYNYLEVRSWLRDRGHQFTTTSDTEVLLEALAEGGSAALERCEGMWAFACYDENEGSLLLSRDRFGEKPLYLYRTTDGVYFGSEIKFLVALLERPFDIDYSQLFRYLVNGYKSLYKQNTTFFDKVEELPPATVLNIDANGDETQHRYWTPRYAPNETMTVDEAVAGVRERLIASVDLRLRADVPLAFCMSGGVDSNALIAIAKRHFGYDVHGFTIASSDARYEESDVVSSVVDELQLRHTVIPTDTTDFLTRMRRLVAYHDSPVYTITYYAHWLLMQSIADAGYRISVSGTAADELFSGYYDHHLAYLYAVHAEPALHAASVTAWEQHIKPIVRNPFLSNPNLFIENPAFRDHIYLDADGFSKYLTFAWSEPFTERPYTPELLRNRMLNELFVEAVPVILHEDDLNAMYFSVENRSPFLDRQLFEFCYSIPTRHLMRDGFAKAILRTAMRGLVPDVVIDNRRKVGFNAPILSLLDTRDATVRDFLLDDGKIFDYVRKDMIEAILQKDYLKNSESKFLFYYVSSKLFLEEFA